MLNHTNVTIPRKSTTFLTCFEMYCLISSSEIWNPFDRTTNATGTSPAASSFILNCNSYVRLTNVNETVIAKCVCLKRTGRRRRREYWDGRSTWPRARRERPGTPCTWWAPLTDRQWRARRRRRCSLCLRCVTSLPCLWFSPWPPGRSDNLYK